MASLELFVACIVISTSLISSQVFQNPLLTTYQEEDAIPEDDGGQIPAEEVHPYEIRISSKRHAVPPGCPSYCPPQTIEVYDRCYRYVELSFTWFQASKDCIEQGGTLAIPNFNYNRTVIELAAVYRTIIGHTFWIGASDMNSIPIWQWVNGSKLSLTDPNWYEKRPFTTKPKCASIYNFGKGPLKMVDEVCSKKRYFLCQFPFLNRSSVV